MKIKLVNEFSKNEKLIFFILNYKDHYKGEFEFKLEKFEQDKGH